MAVHVSHADKGLQAENGCYSGTVVLKSQSMEGIKDRLNRLSHQNHIIMQNERALGLVDMSDFQVRLALMGSMRNDSDLTIRMSVPKQ